MHLESRVKEQDAFIRLNHDIASQLKSSLNLQNELEKQKKQMQKELQQANEQIVQMEDKLYQSHTTSLEMLKQLKETDDEISMLKNYIIDLKARVGVYLPLRDDPTDMRLAELINTYPDRNKLRFVFLR